MNKQETLERLQLIADNPYITEEQKHNQAAKLFGEYSLGLFEGATITLNNKQARELLEATFSVGAAFGTKLREFKDA